MIRSFKYKYTEKLYNGEFVRRFSGIGRQAERRLRLLDEAETLRELENFPSNRFEKLIRDRKDQYSISINMQWRICFKWDDEPYDVEIVDYH
ncbi:proteic killer suppression protein [Nitrosomonas sp. Nm51]|uniref:type II toxin-antitoxin system RelE/ParE family toxin n=1 Tax=Nitrosomonas sp. Nm51 TaxID=133720 RepID=UPI0008D229DA|nr:type II toxin-antitoxin system RelE/ParE family toxin [Nitrosomonas sp. Nm51]SEQ95342.1 proteic killer suppression protein [Nitrosomonas sp. Nm51]